MIVYCKEKPDDGYERTDFNDGAPDDFASSFRKMLTLGQYRNGEMAALYHNCIAAGPVKAPL